MTDTKNATTPVVATSLVLACLAYAAIVYATATGASVLPVAAATTTTAARPLSRLSWSPCWSLVKDWRSDDTRSECTRVAVPLDHARPSGPTVDLLVSRIRATDPARRQGVVLINPGGPGVPGAGMPAELSRSAVAGIGIDHDLIGFDPRGVGHSDERSCPPDPADGDPLPAADLADAYRREPLYRRLYDRQARYDQRCVARDRAFVTALSTDVAAQDLDRIRIALGEEKISYYGISWGTALGAVYRSRYDQHVDRMLLDSVLPPDPGLEKLVDGMITANLAGISRFTDWVAARHGQYHLGRTGAEVTAAVTALARHLDAHPRTVTPPGRAPVAFTGDNLRNLVVLDQEEWAETAASIVALRDGGVPTLLGETVLDENSFAPSSLTQLAVLCNDQGAAPPVETLWRALERKRAAVPLLNVTGDLQHWCAGWPLPAQPRVLRPGTSALQLVGHRDETTTPLSFAQDLQRRIGGVLLTVDDAEHGSLHRPVCGSKAVEFFRTGRTDDGACSGVRAPGGVASPRAGG